MSNPQQILENLYLKATQNVEISSIKEDNIRLKIESICRCITNKAPIRFLMACLIARIDKPKFDVRKPYTEIEGNDTYSGRAYDETYIESFVVKYKLPCNPTTAFLTPAFRNIDRVLTFDLVLVGKPSILTN